MTITPLTRETTDRLKYGSVSRQQDLSETDQKICCFMQRSNVLKTLAVILAIAIIVGAVVFCPYLAIALVIPMAMYNAGSNLGVIDSVANAASVSALRIIFGRVDQDELIQASTYEPATFEASGFLLEHPSSLKSEHVPAASEPVPRAVAELPRILQTVGGNFRRISAKLLQSYAPRDQMEVLSWAIRGRNAEAARRMLGLGISLSERDGLGRTAFQIATRYFPGFAIELADYLPFKATRDDMDYALFSRNKDLIKALLDRQPEQTFSMKQLILAKKIMKGTDFPTDLLYYFILNHKNIPGSQLLIRTELACLARLDRLDRESFFDLYLLAQSMGSEDIRYLLNQTRPGLSEIAQAYCSTKWLSHVMELDGTFRLAGREYDCEGLYSEIGFLKLLDFGRAYNKRFVKEEMAIPEHHLRAVEELCSPNSSPEDLIAKIRKGEPVIISSGWKDHETYAVFYKGFFFKCNRGDGSDVAGIEVFAYNDQKLSPGILKKLREGNSRKFFREGVNQMLALQKVDEVVIGDQAVGNCVWASAQMSLIACAYAEQFYKSRETEEMHTSHEDARQKARGFYEFFNVFSQGQTVSDLRDLVSTEHADPQFMETLERRARIVFQIPELPQPTQALELKE